MLLLLLAGCGGGADTSSPPPAAVRLEAASVGIDGAGNDAVTVTATVTDAAGHPVSGKVEVRIGIQPSQIFPAQTTSIITGTSDGNGRLSVPVAVDPSLPTTITAAAGAVTSNTIRVTSSGNASAEALVAVIPSPDGRYDVNCYRFDGVAGAEVDVSYDPAAASGPVIERGPFDPNALMVSNADTAGRLRMACIMAYPLSFFGAGTLATFYFSQETAASPGAISLTQVKIVDVLGEPLPVRTMVINYY
jgi:hypothetical protein